MIILPTGYQHAGTSRSRPESGPAPANRGIGWEPDSAPPEELDWDFYLGAAPRAPCNRKHFLATYRWFWDYSGGYITDFGTHRFDTVHQVMGVDAPRTGSASASRFSLKDASEIPDILQATYEYPGFILSYEACLISAQGLGGRTPGMKYYHARGPEDRPNGEAYYGANGALFADRIGFEIYPDLKPGGSSEYRMERKQVNVTDATALHAANFIECVRSRKPPNGEVELSHRATIIAHLGNIAFKTGRKLRWDAVKEDLPDAPEASRLLGRQARKPWDLI